LALFKKKQEKKKEPLILCESIFRFFFYSRDLQVGGKREKKKMEEKKRKDLDILVYEKYNGDFNKVIEILLSNTEELNEKKEKEKEGEKEKREESFNCIEKENDNVIGSNFNQYYTQKKGNRKFIEVEDEKLQKEIFQKLELLEECKFIVDQITMKMLKQKVNFAEVVSYLIGNKHLNVRFELPKELKN